jgi:hypothetical protein
MGCFNTCNYDELTDEELMHMETRLREREERNQEKS